MSLERIEELFASYVATGAAPGLVYGVVDRGELVHCGAFGGVRVGGPAPTAESVFRIASMSKSFTAAALLMLRERGLVDLDEAVAQYVPELVDQPPYAADSPAVTLRALLTHSAGLLTDNPWGDRQESLTYEEMGDFLDGGFTVGRGPGIGFEYANLGYALLGRVIENVVGGPGEYRRFVEEEILAPLGMGASRFAYADVAADLLAPGHAKRGETGETGGTWEELAPVPAGAFSAMGGLHSSVADLARWVGGFTEAFRAGRDGHPLAKAARREMQQLHRFVEVDGLLSPGDGLRAVARGYGFGLMVQHSSFAGHRVGHSGGYPGYGSQMAWHPVTGLGVVVLGNGSYAGAYQQAYDALALLVEERSVPGGSQAPRVEATHDLLARAIERVAGFDTAGEEGFANPAIFAENVVQDVPDAERRTTLDAVRAAVGAITPPADPDVFADSLAGGEVVLPAERGRVLLEVVLSPEATPRIQSLDLTALPDAPEGALGRAKEALAGEPGAVARALATTSGEPEIVPVASAVDDKRSEFLVRVGRMWFKAVVPTEGEVVVRAEPTSSYSRLTWLATVLTG